MIRVERPWWANRDEWQRTDQGYYIRPLEWVLHRMLLEGADPDTLARVVEHNPYGVLENTVPAGLN